MAEKFEAIVKELTLPMEQAWVVACDTAYTQSMAHASALAEALGWDRANEMLAKVWEQMGVNAAKTLLEQLKIEQGDASAPGKIIAFTVNNMFPEMKIEVVELSPNRAVDIGRGRCPWLKAAKALGIEGKIDLAGLCTAQVTGISNAANPKISFEQKAGLCRGYEICHGVWEVREQLLSFLSFDPPMIFGYKEEVSEIQVTKEQIEQVQGSMQGIGLVMAYRNSFGEDALQVARQYLAQVRMMLAENSKPSLNILGSDASPAAAALGAFVMQAAGIPDLARVQGNQVVVVGEGFCPATEAAKTLNAPLDKVCLKCSLPMFEGIASTICPN